MLTALLLICYLFLAAFVSGVLLGSLIGKASGTPEQLPHTSLTLFGGLCWLAAWLQVFHLFHRIDGFAHIYIWMVNILFLILFKVRFHAHWQKLREDYFKGRALPLFCISVLAALANVTARTGIGDIADYHLQAIRWMEEYAVVPGLGNLIRQLGNNSNWFLLHAFHGLSFTGLRSVYVLNASLLVISVMYFLSLKNDPLHICKWVILFYIVAMAFRKYVGSVTNDYAITVPALMLLCAWLELRSNDNQQRSSGYCYLFMLMLMPTFKLSAIPLTIPGIFIVFQLLFKNKISLKPLLALLCVAGFIYLPWLYTNVINSGYLCYPMHQTGFFNVDWKMPEAILDFEHLQMDAERCMSMPPELMRSLSFTSWFPLWLKSLDLFSLSLFLGFVLMLILTVAGLLTPKVFHLLKSKIVAYDLKVVWITALAGVGICLGKDPAIRFAFGYLVFFIAISAQLTWWWLAATIRLPKIQYALVFSALLILFAGPGLLFIKKELLSQGNAAAWLITPEPYAATNLRRVPLQNGGYIIQPETGGQCWDGPLPCTGIHQPGLEWRGETPADGFRIR